MFDGSLRYAFALSKFRIRYHVWIIFIQHSLPLQIQGYTLQSYSVCIAKGVYLE